MKFTEEHEALRKTVRQFVESEINPHVDEWEAAGIFPAHELFRKAGELGLLGISKPEEFGGLGLDYSYSVVAAEELGVSRCGGIPMALGVQTDMCTPALARFGSDELRHQFLTPSVAGEMVGCIGVSEAAAGSDVAGIKTRARKDGDDYVISGSKMWITNGTQADWMCALVNTSEDHPHRNKSLVIIPMDAKGVTRDRKLDKLGMRSSDTAEVYFDEVRVPQRYRIGDEGFGFMYQMLQFQEERLWGAANVIGSGTDHRGHEGLHRGPRGLWSSFATSRPCTSAWELSTEISRALVYSATEQYVAGRTRLASMANKSGRLAREVTDSCLQFWGGMGFMWETSVARAYRDTRLISIGGGADEVMLSIICKIDGTLPSRKKSKKD